MGKKTEMVKNYEINAIFRSTDEINIEEQIVKGRQIE